MKLPVLQESIMQQYKKYAALFSATVNKLIGGGGGDNEHLSTHQ
jgi:hypothetical protein